MERTLEAVGLLEPPTGTSGSNISGMASAHASGSVVDDGGSEGGEGSSASNAPTPNHLEAYMRERMAATLRPPRLEAACYDADGDGEEEEEEEEEGDDDDQGSCGEWSSSAAGSASDDENEEKEEDATTVAADAEVQRLTSPSRAHHGGHRMRAFTVVDPLLGRADVEAAERVPGVREWLRRRHCGVCGLDRLPIRWVLLLVEVHI